MKQLFAFIWRKRLQANQAYLVKVRGWRTALMDRPGYGRESVTFCFWWFK